MNTKAVFGLMGLGVMGENLARNIERNGFPVAAWNREIKKTEDFVAEQRGKRFVATRTVAELAESLERPRKILMMVKAGDPVDWTIQQIRPFLEPGDIVIDGGNSYFEDTRRRERELAASGLHFVGCGVSGGESGALWGPSIMPGGSRESYEQLRPILEAIAAKVDDGPCVTYVGPDGAGHFVKMVHNGIEYGDMQLIAEAYDILRKLGGFSADELASIFSEWNKGILNSYLIEITAKIFTVNDPDSGEPLVNRILDKAGQKGTGKWTSQVALELGVAIPTIQAAIEARILSSMKEQRVHASSQLAGPEVRPVSGQERKQLVAAVHDALYASKICSYAQGMAMIQAASDQYEWNINLSEMARIWKGGCIIRAQFLDTIKQAYQQRRDLTNLLLHPYFKDWLNRSQEQWRNTVANAQRAGIATIAMAASLAYYDSYRNASLPQNLTQAQRDFFGSHLYERTDKPELGSIHTDWIGLTSSDQNPQQQ